MDIATGYLEIGGLLELDSDWQCWLSELSRQITELHAYRDPSHIKSLKETCGQQEKTSMGNSGF